MRSFGAYFVRATDSSTVQGVLGPTVVVPGSAWTVSGYRKEPSPPADDVLWGRKCLTDEASRALGEVVYLYADVSSESFFYEHARGGRLLRKLSWFALLDEDWNHGWLCVEVEPEEWEAALFRPDQLEAALELEREAHAGDDAGLASREQELHAIWRDRRLEPGARVPPADGSVARLVERHLGLIHPA